MGERLLVTAAVVLAAVCEILDVSCRYFRDRFQAGCRAGGDEICRRRRPPEGLSCGSENNKDII